MSSNSSTDFTTTWLSIAVTTFHLIFCIVGIVLYAIACWIMIKYRKSTFANPFYKLATALAMPDFLHLSMEIICALPSMLIGFENMPYLYAATCGFLTDVAYFTLAPLMVVIAVNRYVAICHFQHYQRLFSNKRIIIMLICCWIMGVFVPVMMFSCTCIYLFKDHAWKFYCNGSCEKESMKINMFIAISLTLAVAIIYVVIFVQYKLSRKRMGAAMQKRDGSDSDRQKRKEIAIMFQFGLISLVLICTIAGFWIINLFLNNLYGDMLQNFFVNLNSCISPILYICFCSEFRNRLPWKKNVVRQLEQTAPTGGASRKTVGTVIDKNDDQQDGEVEAYD